MAHVQITVPNSGNSSIFIPHNDLDGLQGGNPETHEFYHLTQEQVQSIDNLSNDIFFPLISVGDITTVNSDITITDVVYKINGVQYTIDSQTLALQPEEEDVYRIDIIVANEDGELVIVQGIPDEFTPATPATPVNTVLVTTVNIFGDTYTPMVNLSDLMLKSNEAQKTFSNIANVSNLSWSKENTYRWVSPISTNLVLGGMNITGDNAQYLYNGRLFTIINGSEGGGRIRIKNFGGGDIKFSMGQIGQDIMLYYSDIAVFKYSSITNRLELVSFTGRVLSQFPIIEPLSKGYHFEGPTRVANTSPDIEIGDFFTGTDSDGKFYPCLRWNGEDTTELSSFEGTATNYHRPFPTEPDYN